MSLKSGPRQKPGRRFAKIFDFLPVPFWVYFLSILAGNIGVLPHQSIAYDHITRHVLPVAIILMLIGTPLTEMITMGPKALFAMAIGTGTIFFAQIAAYLLLIRWLPEDAWKSVGALMGTWIGGSANMVAVKEILQMPDSNLSALVIVDAIMSYTWMAFLLIGVRFQNYFSTPMNNSLGSHLRADNDHSATSETNRIKKFANALIVLGVGFIIGEISVFMGKLIARHSTLLPINGWILVSASTLTILLALTRLNQLKAWCAPKIGTGLLYLVLITIGAKTDLHGTHVQASIFLLYGLITFAIHGALTLILGRIFHLPLFLLATSSQANIGGAVSAPVVAEAYQPGTAHIGVLMAVLGAILGTYLGVAGGYICRFIATHWFH